LNGVVSLSVFRESQAWPGIDVVRGQGLSIAIPEREAA